MKAKPKVRIVLNKGNKNYNNNSKDYKGSYLKKKRHLSNKKYKKRIKKRKKKNKVSHLYQVSRQFNRIFNNYNNKMFNLTNRVCKNNNSCRKRKKINKSSLTKSKVYLRSLN